MKKREKRCVTLIEIMIVMFLIAMILGIVAYNYRGTLDEGKAFKTKAGMEKLETILELKIAEDPSAADDIESNWEDIVKQSPLVKNSKALTNDGWGEKYEVELDERGEIQIRSRKYEEYQRTHQTLFQE